MNFAVFKKELDQGVLHPVYAFVGKEEYLAETGMQKVVDKALDPADRVLNLYSCRGDDGSELMDALNSPPFLAKRRVTIIRQADRLAENVLPMVVKFLKSPPNDSVLILTMIEPDKRRTGYKALIEHINPILCDKLKEREVAGWLKEYAAGWGKRLDDEASAQLASVNWPSLREAAAEIDRLVLMAGDAELITVQDISEMGGGFYAFDRWKLTDAIIAGDPALALKTLENLSYFGLKPTQVLGDLYRMLQNIWVIKDFQERKKLDQARELIHLHPFVFNKYVNCAPSIPQSVLEDGMLRVFEAELSIKRGLQDGEREVVVTVGEVAKKMRKS